MDEDEGEVIPEQLSALPNPQPLFPVAAGQSQSSSNDAWLRNLSFTTEPSVIEAKVSSEIIASRDAWQSSEEEKVDEDANKQNLPASYSLVSEEEEDERGDEYLKGEVSSESGKDGAEKGRKKSKRKRKRNAARRDISFRKSTVRAWADAHSKLPKDYYLDTHGDRDNLVYGTLYRVDVPRYKLGTVSSMFSSDNKFFRCGKKGIILNMDYDIDAIDSQLKSGGRYWSPKYSALERHKNLKRLRLLAPKYPSTAVVSNFLPLLDSEVSRDPLNCDSSIIEESWDDEILRKTKEFNKLTRDRPHDEKLWIEFAEFQDKVASMQPQKGARLQTLEKKICLLENAIKLNPESEEILVHLLKSYQRKENISVVMDRWNKALMNHSWSCKLWNEYLAVVQGEFSTFKVSEMRKCFAHCIQALSAACKKHSRQAAPYSQNETPGSKTVELELGLVDLFFGLCRFEWQAGYQELATALLQAEIEFSVFSPTMNLSEGSKLRLFEHFWISDGPRVGEEGAAGWSSWLESEEKERQRILKEQSAVDDESKGWTGWSEPSSKLNDNIDSTENMVKEEASREDSESEDVIEEEDAETLLKQLGIDVGAGDEADIKDSRIWAKWSEEEAVRDSNHWIPLHVNDGREIVDDNNAETAPGVVLFEDICDYLFSLSSTEAQLSLISQFISFFGGKMSEWACTNSQNWCSKMVTSDALLDPILHNLKELDITLLQGQTRTSHVLEDFIFGSFNESIPATERTKFLRNSVVLLMGIFPHNYSLKEAVLVAESRSGVDSSTAFRPLAKSLIKRNRQDVILCGVYAKREAAAGNLDHARRAFDMALSSVEGLPLDRRSDVPLVYLWYAEAELGSNPPCSEDSRCRLLHILSVLATGAQYSPFECKPSSLQILRAHQGFKDKIKSIRSAWTRGEVDDQSTAVVCAAALFEELTAGWGAGIRLLDDAFSMILPGRRRVTGQAEFLCTFHARMLLRHRRECGLARIWEAVVRGLETYPFNPQLFRNLLEVGLLHTAPNKLRSLLDRFCHRAPSVVVWAFALLYEMRRGGPPHRTRSLFERACADEQLRKCVALWRMYVAYEVGRRDPQAAKRVFFRAIHACPWSKKLWVDGFRRLSDALTARELSDLQEVMRDKELNLRTDIYEILLQHDLDS